MSKSMRIKVDGTPFAVKLQCHRTDYRMAVIKARDPHAAKLFCALTGAEPNATWQGPRYFAAVVEIEALPVGIRYLVAMIAEMDRTARGPVEQPVLVAPGACVQCGAADDAHWAKCPLHPENLS